MPVIFAMGVATQISGPLEPAHPSTLFGNSQVAGKTYCANLAFDLGGPSHRSDIVEFLKATIW